MIPRDLLPDEDYRLKMRFAQRPVADFYRPSARHAELVAERRHWLASEPEKYAALRPEGVPLLEETIAIAKSLGTLPDSPDESEPSTLAASDRGRWLGTQWEADYLLMKPDEEGIFRLCGGAVCFPSHWDLPAKMGQSMRAIHGPIPGLNDELGRQIDGFLRRIKPGLSWERHNWGLSRSSALNQHPTRGLPRLDAHTTLEEVWWRIEEQSLVALPETGGILFGIRLILKPLREVRADPIAAERMTRALETMSEPMAVYKGLAPARPRLIELLRP